MEFPAELSQLAALQQACDEAAEGRITDRKGYMFLMLAVEEWFVNICSYAYPKGGGSFSFDASVSDDGVFRCTFKDRGTPFDPLAFDSDAHSKNSSENLLIGGHGIHLIRRSTDSQSYKREDGCNCFTLEKRI